MSNQEWVDLLNEEKAKNIQNISDAKVTITAIDSNITQMNLNIDQMNIQKKGLETKITTLENDNTMLDAIIAYVSA